MVSKPPFRNEVCRWATCDELSAMFSEYCEQHKKSPLKPPEDGIF